MIKNRLLLLAASGSFSLAMLMANSSQAAPILAQNKEGASVRSSVLSDLSVISPSLNWTQNKQNRICHSSGCGCAGCSPSSTSSVM